MKKFSVSEGLVALQVLVCRPSALFVLADGDYVVVLSQSHLPQPFCINQTRRAIGILYLRLLQGEPVVPETRLAHL